jgi:solute carrier family 23 (nucleobase transporter), member 1
MRTIQGAIIVSGLLQMLIGYTGLVTGMLKWLGPVTIAPVITAIGLGLYGVGFNGVSACWSLGLTQLFTIIIFAQYLKFVQIGGIKIFALFPVILAIFVTWSLGAILTASDVWEEGNVCRTDAQQDIITESPWFRVPYPFQWGAPIFKASAIVPMFGGALAGMIESIGDYFSCARLSGAPPPTPGIISRGLACEGIGVLLAGLIGTSNGTTSYSENSKFRAHDPSPVGLTYKLIIPSNTFLFYFIHSRCHCCDWSWLSCGCSMWSLHHHCFELVLQGWGIVRHDAQCDDKCPLLRSVRSNRSRWPF